MALKQLAVAIVSLVAVIPTYAEIGVTDTEVLIGTVTGLTGVSTFASTSHMNGAKAFFEKLNASGGVNGRKIKQIVYDDGYEPKVTTTQTEKLLKQDKVFALAFYHGTPTVKAVLPVVAAQKIPMLFPFSAADTFRIPVMREFFTVRVGAFAETKALLDYAIDRLKVKDFGIIYQDDSFGTSGLSGMQKTLGERGIPLKYKTVASRNVLDISADLDRLKASGAKIVFLYVQAKPAGEYMKKAREKKIDVIGMGPPGVVGAQEYIDAAAGAADGSYYSEPLPWRNTSLAVVKSYHEECKRMGVPPTMVGFEGFMGAAITAEAIRRAGKDLTRDKLISILNAMKDFDTGGLKVSLSSDDHVAFKRPSVAKIHEGKFVDATE